MLGKQAGGIGRFWRNETGMALNIRTEEKFTYGLVGSSDILGIVFGGKFMCLEAKTGDSKQSKEQKNFEAMIKRFGGHYFVFRSAEQALLFVREASGCRKF